MGTVYRKIWQGPADAANCHPLLVEGVAATAMRPGSLAARSGANGLIESAVAATVFGVEPLLTIETPASQGGSISTSWDSGDTVPAVNLRPGEFALALVKVGNNITAKGTPLAAAGDGTLKIAATGGTEQILFVADEIKNVTGSAQLVRVKRA